MIHIRRTVRTRPARCHRRAEVTTCERRQATGPARLSLRVKSRSSQISIWGNPPRRSKTARLTKIAWSPVPVWLSRRADADQPADQTIGQGGVIQQEVEATAGQSRIAHRGRNIGGKGARHSRVRMHKRQDLAVRPGGARVQLIRPPARRFEQDIAAALRDPRTVVIAAAIDHDDFRIRRAGAQRV